MRGNAFDIVVVGGGHAGCEAALAAARMGARTALLTIHLDAIARMSCNPAIGGLGKGQLVREIDALGGEMGKVIDATGIQFRMINTGKGPAMHSPRAQADKGAYAGEMKRRLEAQPGLTLRQEMAEAMLLEGGRVSGVACASGAVYRAGAVVLATGTFLRGMLHSGSWKAPGGRLGEPAAHGLSASLKRAGLTLGRLKTDTPPRVNGRTLDFSRMEPQYGDADPRPFSFCTERIEQEQVPCYATHTTPRAHEIIRASLDRAPLYDGQITAGLGPRYCPSIEIKVVRFPDRAQHLLFIEPEGRHTLEYYCNGLFWPSLETKQVEGLFLAGQINGTSGYEEAAAQGIMAGINAARKLQRKPSLVLGRDEAYIGVLIDDLVTKGTREPYRMFTSLAEYRLLLRQDNADRRLMRYGYENGLTSARQWRRLQEKEAAIRRLRNYLDSQRRDGKSLTQLLRRPGVTVAELAQLDPGLQPLAADRSVCEQVEIEARYEGYFERQRREVQRARQCEDRRIPAWLDYASVRGLRSEAREKLSAVRPLSLGQASRISGVSPADISVLLVYLEGQRRRDRAAPAGDDDDEP